MSEKETRVTKLVDSLDGAATYTRAFRNVLIKVFLTFGENLNVMWAFIIAKLWLVCRHFNEEGWCPKCGYDGALF